MITINRSALCFVIVAVVVLSGCASGSQNQKTTLRNAPHIKISTDCDTCQVKDSVPGLIRDGYIQAVTDAGAKLEKGQEISVTIKEYSSRGNASRIFAGVFAGKDEIKALVVYKNKQFLVEDYYSNAWLGIESLATKIGEMIFVKISESEL